MTKNKLLLYNIKFKKIWQNTNADKTQELKRDAL